jgi:hypothetical protein
MFLPKNSQSWSGLSKDTLDRSQDPLESLALVIPISVDVQSWHYSVIGMRYRSGARARELGGGDHLTSFCLTEIHVVLDWDFRGVPC